MTAAHGRAPPGPRRRGWSARSRRPPAGWPGRRPSPGARRSPGRRRARRAKGLPSAPCPSARASEAEQGLGAALGRVAGDRRDVAGPARGRGGARGAAARRCSSGSGRRPGAPGPIEAKVGGRPTRAGTSAATRIWPVPGKAWIWEVPRSSQPEGPRGARGEGRLRRRPIVWTWCVSADPQTTQPDRSSDIGSAAAATFRRVCQGVSKSRPPSPWCCWPRLPRPPARGRRRSRRRWPCTRVP